MDKNVLSEAFALREREKVPMPPKDKEDKSNANDRDIRKVEALEQISAALVRIADCLEDSKPPVQEQTVDESLKGE